MDHGMEMFAKAWAESPDLDQLPPDEGHVLGDACKFKGELWVFTNQGWIKFSEHEDDVYEIKQEVP